nr:hypothetical protein [Paenibacillus anseongense]
MIVIGVEPGCWAEVGMTPQANHFALGQLAEGGQMLAKPFLQAGIFQHSKQRRR